MSRRFASLPRAPRQLSFPVSCRACFLTGSEKSVVNKKARSLYKTGKTSRKASCFTVPTTQPCSVFVNTPVFHFKSFFRPVLYFLPRRSQIRSFHLSTSPSMETRVLCLQRPKNLAHKVLFAISARRHNQIRRELGTMCRPENSWQSVRSVRLFVSLLISNVSRYDSWLTLLSIHEYCSLFSPPETRGERDTKGRRLVHVRFPESMAQKHAKRFRAAII